MKILFVCLGNICRSPLAEGIFRDKVRKSGLSNQIEMDSVGFEPFHQGDPPDSRAQSVARSHGIDISAHRARLFTPQDFDHYDKIYVMDRYNYQDVMDVVRNDEDQKKVDFIMNLIYPGTNATVADPWYGGAEGFETTFKQLDEATQVLLENIIAKQLP